MLKNSYTYQSASMTPEVGGDDFNIIKSPCFSESFFRLLVAESLQQRPDAWLCDKKGGKTGGVRQRAYRAVLGSQALALLHDQSFLATIGNIAGYEVCPSLAASCYTYYESEADFLDIHLDRKQECSITFLLYLNVFYDKLKGPGPGIKLHIFWPSDDKTYLFRQAITPVSNLGIVLRGSKVPHGRPRLQQGEYVSLLAFCFKRSNN